MGGEQDYAWTVSANSVQGSVAVGGKLASTKEKLVFVPHGFERALNSLAKNPLAGAVMQAFGGARLATVREIRFDEIASVEKTKRDLGFSGLMTGGLRIRLLIKLESGHEEIFVVNHLDDLIEKISKSIGE